MTASMTMAEMPEIPGNGLKVVSTFAGFGGSSLGYRMAGFEVAAAVEIDRVASEVYGANASRATVVNPGGSGDVCALRGGDLLEVAGGELDVLDGSPPCQSWSTAGNRDLTSQNCELYDEFVRLVGEARPRAFVAENVTGIRKGAAKPRFLRFLDEFRAHGYDVAAYTLDGSRLGVAQRRERVVVIGFRKDQGIDAHGVFRSIRLSPERTAIRHVLPEVARLRRAAPPGAVTSYKYREGRGWSRGFPAPTLCANGLDMSPPAWIRVETTDGRERGLTHDDLKALSGFPADFKLPPEMTIERACAGCGNSVPPPMARAWAEVVGSALITGGASGHTSAPVEAAGRAA